MKNEHAHKWKFVRIGGVDQVVFRDGADIAHIAELDQKLWMALAMPTRGIELDPRTADFIDTDNDGRIRPPEVKAAVAWTVTVLKDPAVLMRGGHTVELFAIKDDDILSGAVRILSIVGKPDASCVTLADVVDFTSKLSDTRFNGDGVITPETAEDPAFRKAIEDIIGVFGAVPDLSGKPGINQEAIDRFFTESRILSEWAALGEADKQLTPIGLSGTAEASASIRAVKGKIDDYFTRCRLTVFDSRALYALNRNETDYQALASEELSMTSARIASFPIAKISVNNELSLSGSDINPAWAAAMDRFISNALLPLMGKSSTVLTEKEWLEVQAMIAPYDAWMAGKPETLVNILGLPALRELLKGGFQEGLSALVREDLALKKEFNQMAAVEKLVRFQKDLFTILRNFVNFADFYGKKGALFQTGTLFLDNRSCDLCMEVIDTARHSAMAGLAGMYLAYCDLARTGSAKRSIVAVFTGGDSDNLMAGRNGVFYDRKGLDWDATIIRVVSNPISIREAFSSPYKKFIRMVEEQVAQRASSADAEANSRLTGAATTVATIDKSHIAKPARKNVDIGTVAALGVAFGALSTAFAALATGLMKLSPFEMLFLPVGIIALISGPSMLIAALKLRKRNLGPVLDANGWAINNVARINLMFGTSLTGMPALPPGSERSLIDPYAEKKRLWPKVLITFLLLLVIAYRMLDKFGYKEKLFDAVKRLVVH